MRDLLAGRSPRASGHRYDGECTLDPDAPCYVFLDIAPNVLAGYN